MKYFWLMVLVAFTGCSLMPLFVEEVEELVEFEEDAIKHEIELREKHQA